MVLIRSVNPRSGACLAAGVFQGITGAWGARLASSSALRGSKAPKMMHKKGGFSGSKPKGKNPFSGNSKRDLVNPKRDLRASKPRQRTANAKDQEPEKLGYGNYSSLKEITREDYRNAENLVSKIDNFEALKLLHPVRDAIVNSIKNNTILNSTNYVSPNRFEIPKNGNEIRIKPSPIQIASIKALSKYIMKPELKSFTIAAETGSGKTWAYMAPLIDYLKQKELEPDFKQYQKRAVVRSVVLLPTHELVHQVYNSVKDVSAELDLNILKLDSELSYKELNDAIRKRVDILITTPGRLNYMPKIEILPSITHMFSKTGFLVIDEADTLMDRSWIEDTYRSIKFFPNLSNLVFCSATIPTEFNKAIEKLFPDSIPITTPSLHKLPKTIKFTLIDSAVAPYQGSKVKALAQALYAIHRDGTEPGFEKRVVVFVNYKSEVDNLAEVLKNTYNHDVTTLTGDDTAADRAKKVSIFVSPPRKSSELNEDELQESEGKKFRTLTHSNIVLKPKKKQDDEGSLKVLIATDVLARGLNFGAVRNVILYDVPNTSADLVHRAGRTGRMNQSGRVFLITDKHSKSWVKKLPSTIRNHGLIT